MSSKEIPYATDRSGEYLTSKFEIKKTFKRFNPKFDLFNRSIWDDKINPKALFASYDIANFAPKKSKGFDHWDFALRNASWHLTDHVGERNFDESGIVEGFTHPYTTHVPGPADRAHLSSPQDTTHRIKKAAKLFGAGMVGVTQLDRRWVYSHTFNRKTKENIEFDIPNHLKWVIILILPMDYKLGNTFPSALSGSTTGVGYADSLQSSTMTAQFITNLGYEAMASMNDSALNIPLAIKAGLGEYGRHGLLISKKYGPNVRIAKVFTDLPMVSDEPQEFGVTEFCNQCRKCAESCPPRAIPKEQPQEEPPNISSFPNIKKWTINAEKNVLSFGWV